MTRRRRTSLGAAVAKRLAARVEAVPLADFQSALAARLAENRTFDSYLAGDTAILIEPNTERYSNDLDYFHDSEQRVAAAFPRTAPCWKRTATPYGWT